MEFTSHTSINFHAQNLIDLLKVAHVRINRNKNDVCQAIDLSEKTIVDWYNEITHAYAPFSACFILGKEVTEGILTEFLIFANSRTNSHAIKSAISFLQEIIKRYEEGELRNLIGKLEIQTLIRFRNNLDKFQNHVFDKKILLVHDLDIQKYTKEDAKRIESWICDLDDIRDKVRDDAMEILKKLECRQEMFKKISNVNNSKK